VKFKLDENLPASAAVVLAAGHDVDTVPAEDLTGAPDPDVVSAATKVGRILISLDIGLGDIRAYPPGSHAGIVVLRLPDQSATTVAKTISDLASLTELAKPDWIGRCPATRTAPYPPSLMSSAACGPARMRRWGD
jgi:predicted nuclease of predicted toxin-antitoxin system